MCKAARVGRTAACGDALWVVDERPPRRGCDSRGVLERCRGTIRVTDRAEDDVVFGER